MDIVLWVVGGLVLLLVLLVVIGVVIGGTLPQDHVAMRVVHFDRSAEAIWAAVTDPAIMEARGQGMGKSELVESVPPRLLVRRVVGERDYGGTSSVITAPSTAS